MSLAILFHFLCAQHVSDINTSIIDIGRIVLGSMCVGVSVLLGWSGIHASACKRIPLQPNHTETPTHIEQITIQPMW